MLKLGYNEATCKENSTVERDLALCEKYGYNSISSCGSICSRIIFRPTQTEDLKAFFAKSHLKPFAFNSIENINFCNEQEWKELVELFTFGCEIAQQIGNPSVVVPTVTPEICTKNEKEVFDDSVKVLNQLADIAEPYGVKLSFEPMSNKWCCNSVRQALEIVQAVNRDSVGLTVDCINVYLHDKCADVEYIKKIPKDKLFVFHINDCEDLPLGILDHCHRLMRDWVPFRCRKLPMQFRQQAITARLAWSCSVRNTGRWTRTSSRWALIPHGRSCNLSLYFK